jgi:uncharacterized integral membrane protein (TIGR00698 family)
MLGIAALNLVVLALLAGISLRVMFGAQRILNPGVAIAVKPLLRAAIVLLGLQVTLPELAALGPGALILAFIIVAMTLPATILLGRMMGVTSGLAALLGMGTAICGASAIVAASQVTRGHNEDVSYALAIITLCGTAGMLVLPLLAAPLGLDARAYGLWAGAALHEVAQAVGAAAAGGPEAAQAGTVMKLARVLLLAPAVMALGAWAARGGTSSEVRVPAPWFAFGFLALVAAGSLGLVPRVAADLSRTVVPIILAVSIAGLGLSTDLHALRARGFRPLLLGIAASLLVLGLSLGGVRLLDTM